MTPLMMLALTVPPSIAFVMERWMAARNSQQQAQIDALIFRLRQAEESITATCEAVTNVNAAQGQAQAELKRIAEQVSILSERLAAAGNQ